VLAEHTGTAAAAVPFQISPQKKVAKTGKQALVAREERQYWTEINERAMKGYVFTNDTWFPAVLDKIEVRCSKL